MLSQVNSCGLMGIDGYIVTVEVDISNGMPCFDIVGLPDAAVRESKERVRAAAKNTGFEFPSKRIIINMAPANLKKEGPAYDLPMVMAILSATEQVAIPDKEKTIFIGELSLDGSAKHVTGVLPMVISAYKSGFERMFVPSANASEAAIVEGTKRYIR